MTITIYSVLQKNERIKNQTVELLQLRFFFSNYFSDILLL